MDTNRPYSFCQGRTFALALALASLVPLRLGAGEAVPEENNPRLKKPLPAPGVGPSLERAKLLVRALREGDPTIAMPLFFPQEAFRLVKAIKDPDRYWNKLIKVYLEDIRAMAKGLKNPSGLEFVALEPGRQRRWMERGREGNNLPYWAMYKAGLLVKDDGKVRRLDLRVMINWGDQWYLTHLTRK